MLGNWATEPFSFAGRHYTAATSSMAEPKPVQKPHPPLIIGGSGGPRSAALAARYADEYNTPFPTLQDVRERKARIDEACEQASRAPIPFSVMTGLLVGADSAELEGRARRLGEAQPAWIPASFWPIRRRLGSSAPPTGPWRSSRSSEQAGVSRIMCQHLLHDDLDAVALLGDVLAPGVA